MVRSTSPRLCNCTWGILATRNDHAWWSVPGRSYFRHIEDRFGKGKFQHDLAFIVGHFKDRIQQTTLRALGLQQLPDHGACNFPGAIGVAQLFAFWIGNQLIADTRVEEISRHRSKSTSVRGLQRGAAGISQFLCRGIRPDDVEPPPAYRLGKS